MNVDRIMTRDVVTVTEETKLARMAELMRERKLRHLPVVDDSGRLVGIVSHRDVQRAEPSPITTLDVGEVNYLLAKVTAGQLLHADVVTASPGMLVEEAGRLMRDRRVGCLPVVEEGKLVGIVTGVDLVDFFLGRASPCTCPTRWVGWPGCSPRSTRPEARSPPWSRRPTPTRLASASPSCATGPTTCRR
jgi:CBS-domain-containing membrane protein